MRLELLQAGVQDLVVLGQLAEFARPVAMAGVGRQVPRRRRRRVEQHRRGRLARANAPVAGAAR